MTTSSTLLIAEREVHNIFQLLGDDEDSISKAIAWAFANAPSFLSVFLKRNCGVKGDHDDVQIRIHRYESGGGITDIELILPGIAHTIIEAKRGWVLPNKSQLTLYAKRQSFLSSAAPIKKILTLSECSQQYAKAHLPVKAIGSVLVEHVAWADIIADAQAAEAQSGHAEKRLLKELANYMRLAMTKQHKDSNLVFVVSLSGRTEPNWLTSWIEVVTKHDKYFHPVGNGWPKNPPNYIAFRYKGCLQSIHHIDEYEVIDNLKDACPGIPDLPVAPHYLYKLGSAINPTKTVKNGAVYPSGRVWCAIDTLLTSETVAKARDITRTRGITV